MSFLEEIKRRKVFQVAAVYLVVAWLIVQVVDVVGQPLLLPDWFSRVVIVLLAVGFPIALILSWAFEFTPEGVVRDEGAVTVGAGGNRRIEYVLITLLVVAVGWLAYRVEVAPSGTVTPDSVGAEKPGVLPNSIAVIPFDNMSADPEDAFFAAALHDEILNRLAKLRNLNVIARTSVLQYAGAARPITEIARELNVETVMEGSVSYADGRVAIRAQLIDAETGVHRWSESYNREFSDVFAIQGDIAMNVANALAVEFSLEEQASIAEVPTGSDEAYTFYLRALASPPAESVLFLDEAIRLDPDFALAYALRAHRRAYTLLGITYADFPGTAELEQTIRDDAEFALGRDETLGPAYAALAVVHYSARRGAEADEAFQKAFQYGADSTVAMEFGRFKRYRGEYADAVRIQSGALNLDPENPELAYQLALSNRDAGNYAEAAEFFEALIEEDPSDPVPHLQLAEINIRRRNYDEALRGLRLAESLWGNLQIPFRIGQLAHLYSVAGAQEEAARLIRDLESFGETEAIGSAVWARAYLVLGDSDRALEYLGRALEEYNPVDLPTLSSMAINPFGLATLNEPEFRELLDDLWTN